MICKLAYGGHNKVARLKVDSDLEDIKALITKYYPTITCDYQLYYLDEEDDLISLTNDDDLEIFKEKAHPNFKIHIKLLEEDHPLNSGRRSFIQKLDMSKESFLDEYKEILKSSRHEQPRQSQHIQRRREVSHEVPCSKCKCITIVGIRYQCPFCIDFNLCQICERDDDHAHSLVKVKHPRKELNYAQLLNHLSLVFPNEALISKEKELAEFRNSYDQLLKLVQEMSQNEQSKDVINFERLKQEKEKYKKKFEQVIRDPVQLIDRPTRYVSSYASHTIPRQRYYDSIYHDPYGYRSNQRLQEELMLHSRVNYPSGMYSPYRYDHI